MLVGVIKCDCSVLIIAELLYRETTVIVDSIMSSSVIPTPTAETQ